MGDGAIVTAPTRKKRGRPALAPGEGVAANRGVRLYAADVARLQRLAVRLRRTESDVIRYALERLEAAPDADT